MKKIVFILLLIPLAALGFLLLGLPIVAWLRTLIPGFPAWCFWVWLIASALTASVSLPLPEKLRSALHVYGEAVNAPMQTLSIFVSLGWLVWLVRRDVDIRTLGFVLLALFLPLCAYGVWNALHIRETHYELTLPKLRGTVRIALISDIHLGFFTGRQLTKRILAAVKRTEPELLLIAGDVMDDRIEQLRHPEEHIAALRELTALCPVYTVRGNHDEFVRVSPERDEFLRRAGIRFYSDELVTTNGLRILLRRDFRDTTSLPASELLREVPRDLPLLAVDHNPGRAEELIDAGAELVLCGHTHGGQTFPGTLFYRLSPDFPYGHKRLKGGHLIVTSGIGSFGLPLRIGIFNEVVMLTLHGEA